MTDFNPSPYQQAAFDWLVSGTGNLILRAGAGSGKTTTIVEMVRRCFGSTLFLAFNKPIAEALKARGVNARTFHSLCYSPVTHASGVREITTDKLQLLSRHLLTEEEGPMYGPFITKLVSLARQQGIGCLIDDSEQNWVDIVDHHDMELTHARADFSRAIDLARALLKLSNVDKMVDFDDLLYRAVRDGISLPKFDFVFVDEAQDTNAIQRALLRKVLRENGRLIAVGDPAQAIYGFRGADSNSMDLLRDEFSCKELPLTVSYRCPSKVVEFAKQFGAIEEAPGAKLGAVTALPQWDLSQFKSGDLIVCRVTRPLVTIAYALLRARVPAYVMGKEIGDGLANLIKKLNAKGIDNLIERLEIYTNREVEKAIAKNKEDKAAAVKDKTDCILYLIDCLKESGERTVPALLRLIEQLFDDKGAAVVLATIHKAKGLEADRVYWIDRGFRCFEPRQEWQAQQERNLKYVAATRAKEELFLLDFSQLQGAR